MLFPLKKKSAVMVDSWGGYGQSGRNASFYNLTTSVLSERNCILSLGECSFTFPHGVSQYL